MEINWDYLQKKKLTIGKMSCLYQYDSSTIIEVPQTDSTYSGVPNNRGCRIIRWVGNFSKNINKRERGWDNWGGGVGKINNRGDDYSAL